MKVWWALKAWPWLKRWGGAVLGVALLVLGVGWAWKRQKRRLGRLKDELAVSEATKKLEGLRAAREVLGERIDEKDEEIAEFDRQLLENQRKIVEAHEGGEGLTDEEVLEEFARLGL